MNAQEIRKIVNLEGLPKIRSTAERIKQLHDAALGAADALEAAEKPQLVNGEGVQYWHAYAEESRELLKVACAEARKKVAERDEQITQLNAAMSDLAEQCHGLRERAEVAEGRLEEGLSATMGSNAAKGHTLSLEDSGQTGYGPPAEYQPEILATERAEAITRPGGALADLVKECQELRERAEKWLEGATDGYIIQNPDGSLGRKTLSYADVLDEGDFKFGCWANFFRREYGYYPPLNLAMEFASSKEAEGYRAVPVLIVPQTRDDKGL